MNGQLWVQRRPLNGFGPPEHDGGRFRPNPLVPMRIRIRLFLLVSFTTFLPFANASASCPLNTASPSVTICTPASGASLQSPVQVNAGTTDTASQVKLMQIYVDGIKKYEIASDNVNTSLDLSAGTHRVTVQATDAANTVFKSSVNLSVTGSVSPSACTLNTASPSVTICSPANGATLPSPVQVKAGTTDNASQV